jgi:hypothetical protein
VLVGFPNLELEISALPVFVKAFVAGDNLFAHVFLTLLLDWIAALLDLKWQPGLIPATKSHT